MYTRYSIRWNITLRFAWRYMLLFFIYATLITTLYEVFGWRWLGIPFMPISLIGTAVAFYVGFKNNSSYERLWEARRVWGSLVNASRTFGVYVMDYLQANELMTDEALYSQKKQLIYRHLAYLNALRTQLRRQKVWDYYGDKAIAIVEETGAFEKHSIPEELNRFLPEEEAKWYDKRANAATQLIAAQSKQLATLNRIGVLSEYRQAEFGRLLSELYNQQGASERIKGFPFPRQYAYFSRIFVRVFVLILPLGLLAEFSKMGDDFVWLTLPFHTLVSWVFNTMEVVGDTSENPFENGINDVPLTAICRTIEIDLREMLGETELPERVKAVNDILM